VPVINLRKTCKLRSATCTLLTSIPPRLCLMTRNCETCTFFQTSIEFRPALQAQHDDAITKHHNPSGQLFAPLLARVDQDAS
jgi:hypothetical protein